MHDFQSGTAHAVPQLLAELKSGGYKIVHLRSRAEIRTLPQYDEELQKNQRLPTVSQRPTSNVVRDITLRMVAGFVEPTEGSIRLGGVDVAKRLPHKRDVGMVFQSYALFPHLSVADNIGFGLKRRGVARAEASQRIAKMITLLKLNGLENRFPRQLSGGQQQRVAVGRALVINPAVVLLDEPFSNLDASLRERTREELRRLQTELGLTTLFVTHDQAEAMAISDRIAVMNAGHLEQIGTPREVYERPRTSFVATFLGRANLFEVSQQPHGHLRSEDGLSLLPVEPCPVKTTLMLRPEKISLVKFSGERTDEPNAATGKIEIISFLGISVHIVLRLPEGRAILIDGPAGYADSFSVGAYATALWRSEDLVKIADVGERIGC